jgi:hypothetical protein
MEVYMEMKTNVKDDIITLIWLTKLCYKQKHVFAYLFGEAST